MCTKKWPWLTAAVLCIICTCINQSSASPFNPSSSSSSQPQLNDKQELRSAIRYSQFNSESLATLSLTLFHTETGFDMFDPPPSLQPCRTENIYLSITKGIQMLNKIKKGVKNWVLKVCTSLLMLYWGFEGGSVPSSLLQIYGDVTFGSCKSTICFLASFLPVRWRAVALCWLDCAQLWACCWN